MADVKFCFKCGTVMNYDSNTKLYTCPICGLIESDTNTYAEI